MFTGIIENTGKVRRRSGSKGNIRIELTTPRGWKLAEGQSIAVDGICSTIVEADKKTFAVEYMPETLRKTTADSFAKDTLHNFERSLTLDKFIDGHLVQGHVDTRASVVSVVNEKGAHLVSVIIPKALLRYVAAHGSIAINGVSLTVARMKGSRATVALIPYTLSHTNLGELKKGSQVNIEVDLLARYLDRTRHVR